MEKSDALYEFARWQADRWASGKVLPNDVTARTREWLEAHPVTVADLHALDAEIEKRKRKPRRWRLDYSKLTPQELADLRAMMEKMQVPDEGGADGC